MLTVMSGQNQIYLFLHVEVLGCTDSTAYNYDSSANTDDCIALLMVV